MRWFVMQLMRALINVPYAESFYGSTSSHLNTGVLDLTSSRPSLFFEEKATLMRFIFSFVMPDLVWKDAPIGYCKDKALNFSLCDCPILLFRHPPYVFLSRSWINTGVLFSRNLCIAQVPRCYPQTIYVPCRRAVIAIKCICMVFTGSYLCSNELQCVC